MGFPTAVYMGVSFVMVLRLIKPRAMLTQQDSNTWLKKEPKQNYELYFVNGRLYSLNERKDAVCQISNTNQSVTPTKIPPPPPPKPQFFGNKRQQEGQQVGTTGQQEGQQVGTTGQQEGQQEGQQIGQQGSVVQTAGPGEGVAEFFSRCSIL